MSHVIIDYASPKPAPFDEDEDELTTETNIRRLCRLAILCVGTLCGLTCWCVGGAWWGQRREGGSILDSYAVGTEWYSRLLIIYPIWLSLLILGGIAVVILLQVLRLRWSPGFLLVVFLMPFAWMAWALLMFVTVWDDVFP